MFSLFILNHDLIDHSAGYERSFLKSVIITALDMDSVNVNDFDKCEVFAIAQQMALALFACKTIIDLCRLNCTYG